MRGGEPIRDTFESETPRASGTRRASQPHVEAVTVEVPAAPAVHRVAVADLLHLYAAKRSSLRLQVGDACEGEIVMVGGGVTSARYGTLVGQSAIRAMLRADVETLRITSLSEPAAAPDRPTRASPPTLSWPTRAPSTTKTEPLRRVPDEAVTRDFAADLVGFRNDLDRTALADESPRSLVLERDVLEAAERAVSTLSARRALRSATFGIYVFGRHDRQGLHVGGRAFDLANLAPPIASLRATRDAALFELRIAPYVIVGSTSPDTGVTVLTVFASIQSAESGRGLSTTFALLFHKALGATRVRVGVGASTGASAKACRPS